MIYIFDVLKQNHQFELLLGKGMEKVGTIFILNEQYLPHKFRIYPKRSVITHKFRIYLKCSVITP